MQSVSKVEHVEAAQFDGIFGHVLVVAAYGQVGTTGWSNAQLSPRVYVLPPADGIWDFDFIAEPPWGVAAQVMLPIAGGYHGFVPGWVRGVRVHSASNHLEVQTIQVLKAQSVATALGAAPLAGGGFHFERSIAIYDDSFQPTGTIHWHGHWPPIPHVEMKKLRHELTIVVDGPDEGQIRHCVETAITAGALSAIVAAFATGGLGAVQAFMSGAMTALTSCLGASYAVDLVDRSHWIYWDT